MTVSHHSSWRFWTPWIALTLLLLLLFPSTRFAIPVWELPQEELQLFLFMVAAFVASALVPAFNLWRDRTMTSGEMRLWSLAIFGLLFLGLTFAGITVSRRIFTEILGLAVVLLPISFAQRERHALILLGLSAAIVLALAASLYL
ncbi:MAG TPA: hypothetical protein VIY90_14100, partial [Steroidobacteraceae bacterium]